jgi:hypothetical protein
MNMKARFKGHFWLHVLAIYLPMTMAGAWLRVAIQPDWDAFQVVAFAFAGLLTGMFLDCLLLWFLEEKGSDDRIFSGFLAVIYFTMALVMDLLAFGIRTTHPTAAFLRASRSELMTMPLDTATRVTADRGAEFLTAIQRGETINLPPFQG